MSLEPRDLKSRDLKPMSLKPMDLKRQGPAGNINLTGSAEKCWIPN